MVVVLELLLVDGKHEGKKQLKPWEKRRRGEEE